MGLAKLKDAMFVGHQLYQGLRLFQDPYDLDRVLAVSDAALKHAKPADVAKAVERIRWSEAGVKAAQERYRISIPSRAELLRCEPGSLGHAFGTFLETHGIDPCAVRPPKVVDDLTYLAAHFSETHDIWHVVTGFAPTLEGEAGVAAFAVAQTGSPFQVGIVVGILVNGLKESPWELSPKFEALSRGYQMGKVAAPLFGTRWDERWNEPLADVRASLGLPTS